MAFASNPPRFFHKPPGYVKKAPPFGGNCFRRKKRLHFLDIYPRRLYEYPLDTTFGATFGEASGVTNLWKFGIDNQPVKCQVCRVLPIVDIEEVPCSHIPVR